MISIQHKSECMGCAACYAVCPQRCISMQSDEEGYLYPSVDAERCIRCGLCDKTCPLKKDFIPYDFDTMAFAVQHKDEQVRCQSASGGAFTAFASYVIKQGGVVFGGCYDENFRVVHGYAERLEELRKFRSSKYVQTNLANTFSLVRKFLNEGRLVFFSGTPCQTNAILSFLRKQYDNLIIQDLVCHGIPSPGLFDKYLSYNVHKEKSEIKYLSFRDKHFGYAGSTMAIEFENGKVNYTSRPVQFFKHLYFDDINNRPSCFSCHFKTIKRSADITLFDCWHVNEFDKEMDDDKGTTMVLIHSQKGADLFEKIKEDIRCHKVSVDKAIEIDGDMAIQCPKPNPLRKQFFQDARTMGFDDLIAKYYPLSLRNRMVVLVKPLMYRLGLLNYLMRYIAKIKCLRK